MKINIFIPIVLSMLTLQVSNSFIKSAEASININNISINNSSIALKGKSKNQRENSQFGAAVKEINRRRAAIGKKPLGKDGERRLHDIISGEDYTYEQIVTEGVNL
jgi:hypothetical protein